jgi:hypothetical protein
MSPRIAPLRDRRAGAACRTALAALGSLGAVVTACTPPPDPANPEFSDAMQYAFREFEHEEPANLAYVMRDLEGEIYLAADVEAEYARDRDTTPAELTPEDVASIEHPDRDPALAIPVAVSGVSAYAVDLHTEYPLLADQTPVEPASPDHYDRTILDGTGDCWPARGCDFLRTDNDLTKDNALLTITYRMIKDYRWVDLNLPDPAEVEPGEPAVNDGEKRWALLARSWAPVRGEGEQGNTAIEQSFSVEVWIPRDGHGFVRDGSEENAGGGAWTADSMGGGVLRMLALWAETDLGTSVDEETVVTFTVGGIGDIFEAQEEWVAGNTASE